MKYNTQPKVPLLALLVPVIVPMITSIITLYNEEKKRKHEKDVDESKRKHDAEQRHHDRTNMYSIAEMNINNRNKQ